MSFRLCADQLAVNPDLNRALTGSLVRENRPNTRDHGGSAMTSMDWSKQVGEGPSNYQGFLVPGMFTPFAARLIADLEITPGSAVLDVACGTGVVTRFAARATGTTGTVTGVDIGPPMLAVARSQSAEPDSAPITYLEGSALDLPLATAHLTSPPATTGFSSSLTGWPRPGSSTECSAPAAGSRSRVGPGSRRHRCSGRSETRSRSTSARKPVR